MLDSYSTRIQTMENEKSQLTDMLQRAEAQLEVASENAQQADQRTRELVGLMKWSGDEHPGGGSSSREPAGSKVEIFADPGTYDRTPGKFEDWWIKMKSWLTANPRHFTMKDEDRDEVCNVLKTWLAILSHLQGQKGSYYAEMELNKINDNNSNISSWHDIQTGQTGH